MEVAWFSSSYPPAELVQSELKKQVKVRASEFDPRLLLAAQEGDVSAQEEFVRHYQDRLFAFISRAVGAGMMVEDLAQEVFIRALRALPRFETRDAKLSTWLFQIAVRLIQDQRKRKVLPTALSEEQQIECKQDGPFELLAQRRKLRDIERLVMLLSEEQRIVFVLVVFHGLSLFEVAETTNCSIATVKTRLFRARQHLKEGLMEDGGTCDE